MPCVLGFAFGDIHNHYVSRLIPVKPFVVVMPFGRYEPAIIYLAKESPSAPHGFFGTVPTHNAS